jgi:hypothetical protein
MRLFSVISPLRAIEKNVQGAIAPDQIVLAPFSEAAVEPAFADPFVNGLGGQAQEGRQLLWGQDDGVLKSPAFSEGFAYVGFR